MVANLPGAQALALPESSAPLYERVRHAIEQMVLARPLADSSPLPPEAQLMARFGVSRGTLRRAVEELTRDGLLVAEQGRGTFVDQEARVRRVVWARLERVAQPDSRFDLDLNAFVPDFADRERADATITELAMWHDASTVFLAPDNSLEALRVAAITSGKRVLVPTYGFRRGFVLVDGSHVDPLDQRLAGTLDGMERFGRRVGPAELRRLGRVDLVITGATAVTTDGRHIGGGQRFLALELGMLSELGVLPSATQLVAVVHDCQIVDEPITADVDCHLDLVVTPTRSISCPGPRPRPRPGALGHDIPTNSVS